jgi:hypothetical protein
METMAPFKLWICLAAIGCVLGTVSTLSIQAAPSASTAIIAIRVAHLELFRAKIAFRDAGVHEAEFHLNQAWSTLRDRRYEQSVFAAYEALQRVRDGAEFRRSTAVIGTERRASLKTRRNLNAGVQSGTKAKL